MQKVLTKYGLVFHAAFLVLFPFLYLARPRTFGFIPLVWLSLMALELMALLPSVRKGETLADARRRVFRSLVWDPFLYMGLAIIAFAAVQWCNSGCTLVYLTDADVWQFSKPALAWAPFSVEPRAALASLSVFAGCVALGVILRAAVSKPAKRLLLQGLADASGLAAAYAVWQACAGAEPYLSSAAALRQTALGTFFGFWLLMSMGLFADALERRSRGGRALFLLGVTGNLLGMLFFSSAIALCVYALLSLLLFIYWLVYLAPHVPKQVQLKVFLISVLMITTVAVFCLFLFPENAVAKKLKAAQPVTEYWAALLSTKEIRTEAALKIWQDHPWVGIGADGFHHFVGTVVENKDWASIRSDQSYVYNDCLQFLCEFGVLGGGLLLAAVVTLMIPICYRARIAWKSGVGGENEGRRFLLRLSPIVISGTLATGVCFLESWMASPFRLQGLLMSWVCVMAAMPAFLPSRAQATKQG